MSAPGVTHLPALSWNMKDHGWSFRVEREREREMMRERMGAYVADGAPNVTNLCLLVV